MYNVLLITMQALQQNQKALNHKLGSSSLEDNQPSHYEYEAFDAEKTLKANPRAKTSSAGEFEMPVIDYDGLHSPEAASPPTVEKASNKAESLLDNKVLKQYFEYATHAANGLSIVTSGISALGNSLTKDNKRAKFLENLASFGAKFSMGVNSAFNILNGYKQKDIANVAGYGAELLTAIRAPYNVLGLIRGATSATYQTTNLMASIKPMEKSNSYSDYITQFMERYPPLIKKLFKFDTYKNLSQNIGTITAGWGNLLSYAGVGAWALTGSTKIGSVIKGIGEILIDSYQVLPEQWDRRKQFYIGSGVSFIMGSLCEIISKQRDNDPVTMALYFFGSGIGRMLLTISNIIGENEYGSGGVKKLAAFA
jgi:hypothetical protein